MSDVRRKTVPDKGRLNRERPVAKALLFPFCTGKSFLIGTGTESTRWSVHRETGRQIWWQGTINEAKSKGGYLEKYPFFDWKPVKLFERRCNMLMFAFCEKRLGLHDFEFSEGGTFDQK